MFLCRKTPLFFFKLFYLLYRYYNQKHKIITWHFLLAALTTTWYVWGASFDPTLPPPGRGLEGPLDQNGLDGGGVGERDVEEG